MVRSGLERVLLPTVASAAVALARLRTRPALRGIHRRTASAVLLMSVTSAKPAEGAAVDAVLRMRQGMAAFSDGKVDESISLFDQSAAAGYPQALLWQRGLSLYYANRFEDGSKQFRDDVALNPNDTEESIWAMLCDAQSYGFAEARKRMLKVGRDPRDVMRTVYSMFLGEDEVQSVEALQRLAQSGGGGLFDNGANQFYASLYLGLYAEAKGDASDAQRWMKEAVATPYGESSGDYMADLARVHLQVRGWGKKVKAEL